jgi:restriction system protein
MSILLTIISVIFGFYAAAWMVVLIVSGLAYITAKRRESKVSKTTENVFAATVPKPFVSNIDGSELKQSTKITPKNVLNVDQKIDEIFELINQNKDNNIVLLVFGSMIGLDANQIIGKDADLMAKFKQYCAALLKKDDFEQITKARIDLGEYYESIPEGIDVYYEIFVEEFFERFKFIFINFDEYVKLIESKNGIIASKKRTLVSENEFGDLDGTLWMDYLQRFADKMGLVNPHAVVASEFEAVREILKILKLDNFQGKVLGYIFALNEHYSKKEDPFANVITGVDFELMLKSMMESALPEVYVETTPATGDHGADLIARYKGITIAIQAKYYSGSVGNAAVQEIHSGIGFYDADFGMVVTQSSYTEHAKSLANKLGIYLESVGTFVDRIKVLAR